MIPQACPGSDILKGHSLRAPHQKRTSSDGLLWSLHLMLLPEGDPPSTSSRFPAHAHLHLRVCFQESNPGRQAFLKGTWRGPCVSTKLGFLNQSPMCLSNPYRDRIVPSIFIRWKKIQTHWAFCALKDSWRFISILMVNGGQWDSCCCWHSGHKKHNHGGETHTGPSSLLHLNVCRNLSIHPISPETQKDNN